MQSSASRCFVAAGVAVFALPGCVVVAAGQHADAVALGAE